MVLSIFLGILVGFIPFFILSPLGIYDNSYVLIHVCVVLVVCTCYLARKIDALRNEIIGYRRELSDADKDGNSSEE